MQLKWKTAEIKIAFAKLQAKKKQGIDLVFHIWWG
jgi:hypothetical protein